MSWMHWSYVAMLVFCLAGTPATPHERLAYAPVEDLAFGFALVLTGCVVWTRLGRRRAVPA